MKNSLAVLLVLFCSLFIAAGNDPVSGVYISERNRDALNRVRDVDNSSKEYSRSRCKFGLPLKAFYASNRKELPLHGTKKCKNKTAFPTEITGNKLDMLAKNSFVHLTEDERNLNFLAEESAAGQNRGQTYKVLASLLNTDQVKKDGFFLTEKGKKISCSLKVDEGSSFVIISKPFENLPFDERRLLYLDGSECRGNAQRGRGVDLGGSFVDAPAIYQKLKNTLLKGRFQPPEWMQNMPDVILSSR